MDTTHGGMFIGSYGRKTTNSWVSDVDMLFEMPQSLKDQYDNYTGNGQSALLQAVKNSIAKTYSNTYLKGDGQVVTVKFSDNFLFEILPSFKQKDESYLYPDANSGGSWKNTNPKPEIEEIRSGDKILNRNLKRLCRMSRAWKYYNNVPIKGILIDTLAYRFLLQWEYSQRSFLYYDWMSRDFFNYLKNQPEGQTIWYALGSYKNIDNTDDFRYKAKVAYNKSLEAIELEEKKYYYSSKQKWREIYGYRFPS